MKNMETTLVISDIHGIYIDEKWWQIVKQVIDDVRPNRVIIDGDLVDFYRISSFNKDPMRLESLQDEINATKKFLDELQFHHMKGETIWVAGNHENRLQTYLWGKAPELASLDVLDMDTLFELNKRQIEYVKPKGKEAYYTLGKIKIGHFNKACQESAYTAKALVTRYGCSIIQGHTHRLGKYYKSFGGEENLVMGVESGCGCTLDPEYCCDPNWMQGFVFITKLKNDNRYYIEDVPVIDHQCVFNGKYYKA